MPINFKKLMFARFFFTFAVQMQAIILGWRMYEITKDPLYLGLIGLFEALPALSLAIFAGYIVDKSRPFSIYKKVVLVSLTSGIIMLFSGESVELLFLSAFLTGCARAFSQPAMFSIIPKLLPRALFNKSSAYISTISSTARISGPAVGGLLYGYIGVFSTSFVICSLLVLTFIALMRMDFNPPANVPGVQKSVKEELLLGAKFVFRHPILFPALTLDMVSVMFGGVTALLPVFAAEILFVGPMGLGLLRSAPAIGAFLMSYWLMTKEIKKQAGLKLFVSVMGFGVCILIFAISRNYILSLMALVFSGAFDSISMVIRTTAVQISSPDHMRGRISAVNSIFIGSSNELGEFESGVAAKILGAYPAAIFGGVVCMLTVGVVAFFSPKLRKLSFEEKSEQ